ncbi:MAG TPA: hypothetical protein PLR92_16195, partial [Alicycliphilus denitrificans]|nr:hypothetical protein [Alicycliphilus denitrificans]
CACSSTATSASCRSSSNAQKEELPALSSKGFQAIFILKPRSDKRQQLTLKEHAKESDYAIP